jgi:hypothetical protein
VAKMDNKIIEINDYLRVKKLGNIHGIGTLEVYERGIINERETTFIINKRELKKMLEIAEGD